MKIQLKRSNVLDGSSAKQPGAEQLEYGELAVNYNSDDPVIFLKDSSDQIIRIAGNDSLGSFSGDYDDLNNKPIVIGNSTPSSPALNDLWLDTSQCPPELKVWSECKDPGNSEWITIGGELPPPIAFNVIIEDDGTDTANFVGNTLTAEILNIVGGIEPQIVGYEWYVDDVADVTTQQKIIQINDVGKTISCIGTVAEPNGAKAVSASGVYSKTPAAGIINKPQILTPKNGAGVGGPVNYYPQTSAVDTGGVETVDGDWNFASNFSPAGNRLSDVVYGFAGFVATFTSGASVAKSTDGDNWSFQQFDASATYLYGITVSDDTYVAVGQGAVYHSQDATNWTKETPWDTGTTAYGVAYGDNKFVAALTSSGTGLKYSTNKGVTWNDCNLTGQSGSLVWISVAYGAGKFVVGSTGGSTRIAYSSDGINFTAVNVTSIAEGGWLSIAYGAGKFIAIYDNGNGGSPGTFIASDDGVTWYASSQPNISDDFRWKSIRYDNNRFILAGTKGALASSVDGASWTILPTPNDKDFYTGSAYGNGKFVVTAEEGSRTGDENNVIVASSAAGTYTALTLTNNKTFDSTDGTTERGTINSDLLPGALVTSDTAPAGTSAAFTTTLYAGAPTPQTVVTNIDNTSKSLLWIKVRDQPDNHRLEDTVRANFKTLSTNNIFGEDSAPYGVTQFNSNGFDVGTGDTSFNTDGDNYVAWNFRAAPGFMDIVAFNNTGYPISDQIAHNLQSNPGCIIVKQTDASREWFVYHTGLADPASDYLKLDSTNGATLPGAGTNTWIVDDKTFGSGGGYIPVGEHVAYLFADNPTGGIKCGSYSSDGSDPQQVDVGFEPEWVMVKNYSDPDGPYGNWYICDNKRPNKSLVANRADAEDGTYTSPPDVITLNSTGFSVPAGRASLSAGDLIYVAIAKDVTAGNFPPTGIVSEANDTDSTLTLTNVSGTWEAGMRATGGTELTEYAPDPAALEFVGSIPNGTDINTWSYACWEVSENFDFSGTVLKAEPLITDPTALQTLPAGTLALANDTQYYAQLKYEASDPDIESNYSSTVGFKTAPIQDGWFAGTTFTSSEWHSMAYADGMYAAIRKSGSGTIIAYSTNIEGPWTYVDSPDASVQFFHIAAGDVAGTTWWVIASRSDRNIYVTTDPTDSASWTAVLLDPLTKSRLRYVNNTFVFTTEEGKTIRLEEGENPANSSSYLTGTINADVSLQDITYGDGKWVVCGYVYPSYAGRVFWGDIITNTWNEVGGAAGTLYFGIAYTEKDGVHQFAAISNNGNQSQKVLCTDDISGGTWYTKSAPTDNNWITISAKDGTFVIGSSDGNLAPLAYTDDIFANTNPFQLITFSSGINPRFSAILNNYFVFLANDGAWKYSVTGKGTEQSVFYDADAGSLLTEEEIIARYGVEPTTNLNRFGIYELTEQPTYEVQGFTKAGDKYQPISDYCVAFEEAKAEAEEANARLDTANATIETIRADFEARITALEP